MRERERVWLIEKLKDSKQRNFAISIVSLFNNFDDNYFRLIIFPLSNIHMLSHHLT